MEIQILTNEEHNVRPGQCFPPDHIIPKDKRKQLNLDENYILFSGSPRDDIDGEEVLITGKEYIFSKRHYNLSAGYALLATLTPKNILVPKLRVAVGRETSVSEQSGGQGLWPIIRKL